MVANGTSSQPPPWVVAEVGEVHERFRSESAGEVARYIPALATADPAWFGIAVVGTDGSCAEVGDSRVELSIQSVSKPFVYALALRELGLRAVHRAVGTEPSGEGFNAISLEPGTGRPANPMINAGAIVTSSLVPGDGAAARFAEILRVLSAFAGRELTLDEVTFESERSTGDRNRALAYLMHGAGALPCGVDEALDVYFRQCSVLVTTVDLAVMAATLANGGVNPRTGVRVVDDLVAAQVLTMMVACGMYDFTGEWLLRVGLPAKSGVSGGLLAASPGRFGVGTFSPPLDAHGNSVRGVAALSEVSERLGLHLMYRAVRAGDPSTAADPAAPPNR